MTPDEILKYQPIMEKLIPVNGETIGNRNLLTKWIAGVKSEYHITLTESDYWEVRLGLINKGKIGTGRGKGGSVYLLSSTEDTQKEITSTREIDLYDPFQNILNQTWSKSNGYKDFITEITGMQGRRDTGGKWTRPDVVLIAVTKFPFIPGKVLDVVTFEIKPADAYGIEGVYETASHSVYAHKSYFAIHLPENAKIDPNHLERIERECKRFRIGFVTFTKVDDWSTYETIVEAERNNPDPSVTSGFISAQIKQENQNRVLELLT